MTHSVPVKIKADSPEFVPQYKSAEAAAADIVANIPPDEVGRRSVTIMPNQVEVVDAGFSVEIPEGWEMQIRCRSGLAAKGLQVTNSPGTIDSDYTGRVRVILNNTSKNIITVNHGDRIAQILIKPVWRISWVATDRIEKVTERAGKGFGSTGMGE